ncbi:MAG: cache domain-containing protein [Thermodesulfobacteriota bacterium]|nr:cache domain-containing protein [Thermodesulfobacteriota bacterium]
MKDSKICKLSCKKEGNMKAWINLKIRHKLLISYLTLFIFSIAFVGIVIYCFVRSTLEHNIESELKNSTTTIFNMVRTSATVSIKNYLRAVAEKNKEIAAHYYDLFHQGKISEEKAKAKVNSILLSQTIGKSGYIYCVNTRGVVTIHPRKKVLGTDVSEFLFVRDQMKLKEGYIEYQWKNPGEKSSRPKALYMSYFKPWDWIISVSSYRNEFTELINVNDFRDSVLSLKFGKTGYSYVTDGSGNTVIHPKMEGVNIFKKEGVPSQFFTDMLEQKSGKIIYSWKNPGEQSFREKLVIFNYIPELDWIVASSSYLDEFYSPMRKMRNIIIITMLIAISLAVFLIFRISSSITTPLKKLMDHLENSEPSGNVAAKLTMNTKDEIGMLGRYFNRFMDKLSKYSFKLEQEIKERKEIEKALKRSEDGYREAQEMGDRIRRRIGQNLHDDLCPHLIGIQGFCTVLKKNIKETSSKNALLAEKIGNLIFEATDKARNLSKGLCTAELVAHGLESALRNLCEKVEEFSNLSCSLDQKKSISLEKEREAHIYYIVQEAVYNAVKHGKPDHIVITLAQENKRDLILIEDNGTGMKNLNDSKGAGLRIMIHRAEQADALIFWENIEKRGARVKIVLNNRHTLKGRNQA